VRQLALIGIALGLSLTTLVHAQSEAEPPPAEDQAPSGPLLQPSDSAPVICDPSVAGFRYVQVSGSGFDAWATQRLVGDVIDASGARQIHWGSIWVTPQGRLTLEVNLCADPFQKRPALAAGDYTVAVGQNNGAVVAATTISLAEPPDPMPAVQPPTTFTPKPIPTAVPRVGIGSVQQPVQPGASGTLVDGWKLMITSVNPDAYNLIHAAIPSSQAPPADQRDLMIRAEATYIGPGTGVFSAVRLALVSGIQNTYDQIRNTCGAIPEFLPPNVVTSGTVVLGNVCFTVRASDIDSLVLLDNQTSDADKVYFALK